MLIEVKARVLTSLGSISCKTLMWRWTNMLLGQEATKGFFFCNATLIHVPSWALLVCIHPSIHYLSLRSLCRVAGAGAYLSLRWARGGVTPWTGSSQGWHTATNNHTFSPTGLWEEAWAPGGHRTQTSAYVHNIKSWLSVFLGIQPSHIHFTAYSSHTLHLYSSNVFCQSFSWET